MAFYVKSSPNDVPKGPFEIAEIVLHIENAWLPESAEVAPPGAAAWVPIQQVPEFAVAFGRLRQSGLAIPSAAAERKPYVPPGALSCSMCSGPSYGSRGCLFWFVVISGFLTFLFGFFFFPLWLLLIPAAILLFVLKPTYRCKSCGYTFQT